MEDRYKTFTTLLFGISRNISHLKSEVMGSLDLRRSHLSCIYYIYCEGSVTATRLVTLSGEDKANISRTLKNLEDDGYILREARKNPHQRVRVSLTESGRKIGEALAKSVTEITREASRGVSPEDLAAMYRALGRIERNLSDISARYSQDTEE